MLGNSAGLACNNVGVADVVEQRSLTVVYVSHYSNDGRTRNKVGLIVSLFGNCLRNFCTYVLGLEPELFCNKVNGFGIEALVDRNHDAHAH